MPSKIPRLGDYDWSWRKKRKALLARQPLCALCQAAGRVVPATIVDHKTPLADGGTNDESNLQPLCKLCHDALKTPADRRQRQSRRIASVIAVWLGEPCPSGCIDLRAVREAAALQLGWNGAHQVMLDAAHGIVSRSATMDRRVRLCIDDAACAMQLNQMYGIEADIMYPSDCPQQTEGGYGTFLQSRYGHERLARQTPTRNGPQPPRTGTL